MIGTEQWVIPAQNPQLNALSEQQNKTIEDPLVKVHDGNLCDWPNITAGVLFTTFRAVP